MKTTRQAEASTTERRTTSATRAVSNVSSPRRRSSITTAVPPDRRSLRGLPAPGRGEVVEALQTALTHGEVLGRGRVVAAAMETVLVGDVRGSLAPGARTIPVLRLSGNVRRLEGSPGLTVLGLPARDIPSLRWRSDYSPLSRDEIAQRLRPSGNVSLRGVPLPENARRLVLPVLIPLLVLAFPLGDLVLAVLRRIRRRQSPFKPDKEHLHHRPD